MKITYNSMTATDALVGVSCGIEFTSSFEPEEDLTPHVDGRFIIHLIKPARYELFGSGEFDIADGDTVKYRSNRMFSDARHEPDDSFANARALNGDADDTIMLRDFSAISPAGNDVDFFKFIGDEGRLVTLDLVAGGIDSIIGLFDSDGNLLAVDDDGKGVVGGLSIIEDFVLPADGLYFVGVSTWPDFDFDGLGGLGGEGRYVLIFTEEDAPTGVELFLPGDGFQEIPLFFDFPYQGALHNSVFVNANGSLTFGGGDSDWTESASEFVNGLPRIAPLWDDLEPDNDGTVFVDYGPGTAAISFTGVPHFNDLGQFATFSVSLDSSGAIVINYGALDPIFDGLAGVTEGGGAADPGESDLSGGGPFSASGTTYEIFGAGDPNDLALSTVTFNP